MKQYAFTCNLKDDPEVIARYKEYHRAAWPEVLESLRRIGIERAFIYLLGRRLFMVFETGDDYDPAVASEKHWNSSARVREWEELMRSFQERAPEAPAGTGTWAPMERVFDMPQIRNTTR
jgi:L-rhamnose mutarotase